MDGYLYYICYHSFPLVPIQSSEAQVHIASHIISPSLRLCQVVFFLQLVKVGEKMRGAISLTLQDSLQEANGNVQ